MDVCSLCPAEALVICMARQKQGQHRFLSLREIAGRYFAAITQDACGTCAGSIQLDLQSQVVLIRVTVRQKCC